MMKSIPETPEQSGKSAPKPGEEGMKQPVTGQKPEYEPCCSAAQHAEPGICAADTEHSLQPQCPGEQAENYLP